MADRVEREIEEILARLDTELPQEGSAPTIERKPISISSAREARQKQAKRATPRRSVSIEPATLLFTGAGVMVVGLILSSAVNSSLIWLSFAGVVLFLAAFIWSVFRQAPERPMSGGGMGMSQGGGKVFWRDRYIDVSPSNDSVGNRLMRRIRRK